MRAQFGAALMLLTRLPGQWLIGGRAFPAAGDCVWAYPLVGGMIGGVGMAVLALVPSGLGAAWALVAMVALSGGLHEDGLADMADGFGGGRSVEGKLAIMRDSRVGSYGALALVLSVLVRWAALTALAGRPGGALVAAGALSRAAMIMPLVSLGPARSDGLGTDMGRVSPFTVSACVVLSGLLAVLGLPWRTALAVVLAAGLVGVAVSALARRQIGGFTGDVLGACAVISEAVVLSVAAGVGGR